MRSVGSTEPSMTISASAGSGSPVSGPFTTRYGSPPNQPPDEQSFYRAFLRSALLRSELEAVGVPGITGVWCHEVGGSRLFNAVSIEQRYAGHARQVGHLAATVHAGAYLGRYVIVVDDDIDVMDLNDVVWAMSTRSDPVESIDIIKRAWSGPLQARWMRSIDSAGSERVHIAQMTSSRSITSMSSSTTTTYRPR